MASSPPKWPQPAPPTAAAAVHSAPTHSLAPKPVVSPKNAPRVSIQPQQAQPHPQMDARIVLSAHFPLQAKRHLARLKFALKANNQLKQQLPLTLMDALTAGLANGQALGRKLLVPTRNVRWGNILPRRMQPRVEMVALTVL